MGCDIHAYLERRFNDKETQYWGCVSDLEIDRWYELFGYLAGVRDSLVDPIAQPRGLPTGLSWEVKDAADDWKEDMHSASWLSVPELEQLPDKFKDEPFYETAQAYAKKHGKDNVRLVFWFDN